MSGLFVDNDGKMNWKKFGYHARSAFAVLLSLAVLIGGGWAVYSKIDGAYKNMRYANDYPGPGGDPVTVTIGAGATVSSIGQALVKADVVKSVKAFTGAAQDAGDQAKFQSGEYRLRKQIPAATAVEMLLDKKNKVVRQFTVPEGMRVSDVLALISKKTGISVAALQKEAANTKALGLPKWATNPNVPEGFLFPDTYQYDANPTPAAILPRMTAEFKREAAQVDLVNKAEALGYTPLQVLTVASIVDAEVPGKYQAEVAGVIYNRLRAGLPLGLDTSVYYAVNKPATKSLTSADFKSSSPFNTFVHTGLMPGPINSPGAAALKAALNPATTDNMYFVTVNLKTGETKFAKTYDEHNTYVAQFEAWCKKNPTAGCPTS